MCSSDLAAAGSTSQYPLDGYLIVDGPGVGPTGNLVIGTANPSTNVVFAVGGMMASNVVATLTPTSVLVNKTLQFSDGTTISSNNQFLQNTATITVNNNIIVPNNITGNNATFSGNITANYITTNNVGNATEVNIQVGNS